MVSVRRSRMGLLWPWWELRLWHTTPQRGIFQCQPAEIFPCLPPCLLPGFLACFFPSSLWFCVGEHASSAPLSIHTALFPLFWSLSISGVFAAFEYGDGRTPSHASLCMNDSLLCAGTFEPIQGSLRSHLSKHVSIDTPLPGTLPTKCHAHAHAMCACSMC